MKTKEDSPVADTPLGTATLYPLDCEGDWLAVFSDGSRFALAVLTRDEYGEAVAWYHAYHADATMPGASSTRQIELTTDALVRRIQNVTFAGFHPDADEEHLCEFEIWQARTEIRRAKRVIEDATAKLTRLGVR